MANAAGSITGNTKLTKWIGSVLSASTYNSALAMPAVAREAPETNVTSGLLGIATQGRGRLDLRFGGTTGAGQTLAYHVIGWRQAQANGQRGWIPEKVANGVATFGADVFDTEGVFLEASAAFWADTITETLGGGYATVYSPRDDTVARLSIDVSPFMYVTVRVTRSSQTAATMTVVANLADWIGGISDNVLEAIKKAVGGGEALYEYFSQPINQAAGVNAVIEAAQGGKQIWVYGWLVHAGVAAGTYQWLSAANARTGLCPVGVNGGGAPTSDRGSGPAFKCGTNEDLKLTTVTSEIDGVVWGRIVTI